MSIRRNLILVLVMLWLPLQGFAAVAMPFCRHALGDADAGVQHEHRHHGHPGGASDAHQDDGSPMDLSCSDCGACYLACAPIVPCTAFDVMVLSGHAFGTVPPDSVALFIPPLPTPPPLDALV